MTPRISFRSAARALAIGAMFACLAACGFHLRDALLLPAGLGAVRIAASDPDGQLPQQLETALQRAGATIAEPGASDVATLHLVSERLGDTAISVDQHGRAQEYTLRYAVIFDLRRADGTDLVPQQAIELSRDYISVPTHSAGTEGERDVLVRELRREMVSSILRRIDAVSRLQQSEGTVPAAPPVP